MLSETCLETCRGNWNFVLSGTRKSPHFDHTAVLSVCSLPSICSTEHVLACTAQVNDIWWPSLPAFPDTTARRVQTEAGNSGRRALSMTFGLQGLIRNLARLGEPFPRGVIHIFLKESSFHSNIHIQVQPVVVSSTALTGADSSTNGRKKTIKRPLFFHHLLLTPLASSQRWLSRCFGGNSMLYSSRIWLSFKNIGWYDFAITIFLCFVV